MAHGNDHDLEPYRSSEVPVQEDSSEKLPESCCTGTRRTLKFAMVGVAIIFGMMNVVLYASPSLSERVGSLLPDFFASTTVIDGHNRGCGCHCESSCELPSEDVSIVALPES